MWPTQPSFWWMVAVTSPNCAPRPGRVVEVPADRDLRARDCGDVPQVVAQQVGLRLAGLGHRRAGLRRHGVADDRPKLRKQAADLMRQEAGVPRPDIEQLDRVRDRRRVVPAQLFEFRVARVSRSPCWIPCE